MKQKGFIQRILFSGILGTTAMTAYSYLVSWIKGKNYREPVLLSKMATRLLPLQENNNRQWTGWLLHYLIGLLFAELYAPWWESSTPSRNIKKGLVLGGMSGIAAILIWKFTLTAHPLPPAVDFCGFAAVLFVAHIVFGMFTAIGYQFPKKSSGNFF